MLSRRLVLNPSEIDYINAHGTSTGLNDKYETAAVKLAFGDDAKNVKINSTKSMIGHLLGAAGAVEAIVCAKSIQEGLIHKTVGYKVPDEECDLNYCTEGNIQRRFVQLFQILWASADITLLSALKRLQTKEVL